MLKILYKTDSHFKLVLLLSLLLIPVISMAQANKAAADGSFVQAWLCGSWSDARWQQEFSAMKAAGMHYLVIGPVAECTEDQTAKTLYPSTLPNTEMDSGLNGLDMLDECLRNAESADIKVFIGISSNDLWWDAHGADTTWLYNQMEFDNAVCDEVWSLYKNKYPNAFYGWYWAYEVDNASFSTDAQQNELIHAMNLQLDHLTATNEKLHFMWCPFMNSSLGTPQAYQSMWQNVFSKLHTTSGDIFCPQDCIGAGGLTLSNVASWFSALHQAVDTKPGLVMWSDVETFDHRDWSSALMDRFITQLKLEQPYVDNYVTFAYCHYDSPYNTDPGYQATYLDYIKTGQLETTPPTVPPNFSAVLQGNGDEIALKWDPSTDDIGVCGYYVYRNGKMICKMQVPRIDGRTGISPLPTNLTDAILSPNTTYTYQVQAFDFANNLSPLSFPDTINTGNIYLFDKVSGGCSYTVSIPADSKYPDPTGSKLTDGIYARIASIGDPSWVGFLNADTLYVKIDLGQTLTVQQFIADYLYDPIVSVNLPADIKVFVSKDNITFSDAGDFPLPNVSYNSPVASYKYCFTLSTPVEARYIIFRTIPSGSWTFADEFEVRNNNTTGIIGNNDLPNRYSLLQNYPNPFNPTTIIKYQLPVNSYVTLKLYDIVGREIRTLINTNQQAGTYNVTLNASHLSSGVYFYRFTANNYSSVKKLILVK